MRSQLKHILPSSIWDAGRYVFTRITKGVRSDDLVALAEFYGTDKWGNHRYAQHYGFHFQKRRLQPVTVIEIGVGGHVDPKSGGASLRMWKHYFPKGQIHGVDLHDKSPHQENRISIHQGDQSDSEFLAELIRRTGAPDIIIDDGSHIVDHVRITFDTLFPLLAENGIYVIEDLQTSYWPEFGGSTELRSRDTTIGWLKDRVDGLNYEEFLSEPCAATEMDVTITGLHFYHNMVFIQKGRNNEGSNQRVVRN